MNDAERKRVKLGELLKAGQIVVAPGAYDALAALLVQEAGFPAVYMSGGAVSISHGMPDVGLLSMGEIVARAKQMATAVNVPLIADADDGYGNPVNVYRTVKEFEWAGVAGIHLEDQVAPKKCGSLPGKDVVPLREMVAKLEAAQDAREDKNFVIIARTDSIWSHGLDEAIKRGKAYRDAGADLLMFHGPKTEDEIARIVDEVQAPVVALNSESGTMPMIPVARLQEIGVSMVLFPASILRRAVYAMRETLKEISEKGTTKYLWDTSVLGTDLFNVVGLKEINDLEKKYVTGASQ